MLRRRDHLANGRFPFDGDGDDSLSVDYSSAGLYVVGIQTVLGCACCAATSVLFCWALPRAAISAVRTLAGTSAAAVLFVSKPLRLGRVRGVNTVFNALRVSVPLYIFALVIEQILHTCTVTTRDEDESVALRVVFHVVVAFMILSGFVRARRPVSETDMSFLIVMVCFLILALLPPPATALTGPLCEPATVLGGAERVLRALLFSSLYATHVYSAVPRGNSLNELCVCVARSATACAWTLACHTYLLPLAPVQAGVLLASRFSESDAVAAATYSSVDQSSEAGLEPRDGSELEDGLSAMDYAAAGERPLDAAGLAAVSGSRASASRSLGLSFNLSPAPAAAPTSAFREMPVAVE